MKKHLLSIVLIATVGSVFAQVPATKPIVKGIVWLGQSTPPATPGLYEQYKDSDDGITYEWDGDSWEPFGAGAADGNDFPTGLNLTGTLLTLTVPNHADPSVDLAPLQDGDNQELGITGNLLTIENGTIGIDLSTYLDGPASSLANADQLIPAGTTREVQMGDAVSEILFQNSAGNASILALDDSGAFFGISARVPDMAYDPTWDGSINVPTRNAIYDKIESLMGADIGYDPAASGLVATNLQDAIDELADGAGGGTTIEEAERIANTGVRFTNLISGGGTLDDTHVSPSTTPHRGKTTWNRVTGKDPWILNDGITLNKTFLMQGATAGDTVVVKPSATTRLLGAGNIALDATVEVDSIYVHSMDIMGFTKLGTDLYAVAGNFTAVALPGFLDPPNASNPNPEMITGDAVSFEGETNTIDAGHTVVGATLTSVADATNGYGEYMGRVKATETGTLKRARINDAGTYTSTEIYEVYIACRQNTLTDSGRYRIVQGSSDGDHNNTHAAHTDLQIHSFEYVSDGVVPRVEVFARNTVSTIAGEGEYTDFKVSIKQKDD